jgi:hypothetical protein
MISIEEELFPFCIVWTTIPIISWLLPFVGHTGIGKYHFLKPVPKDLSLILSAITSTYKGFKIVSQTVLQPPTEVRATESLLY